MRCNGEVSHPRIVRENERKRRRFTGVLPVALEDVANCLCVRRAIGDGFADGRLEILWPIRSEKLQKFVGSRSERQSLLSNMAQQLRAEGTV